jgi:hypothetical protein
VRRAVVLSVAVVAVVVVALVLASWQPWRDPHAAFVVTNTCAQPVEFRVTDDEMIGPNWRRLDAGEDVSIVADRSPVDRFWFEVRSQPGLGSITYQPGAASVVFSGEMCSMMSPDAAPSGGSEVIAAVSAWTELSADGEHHLDIVVLGGPPFAWDDACSTRYEATVAETTEAVRILVREFSPAPPGATEPAGGCPIADQERSIRVALDAPIADRRIVEDSTGTTRAVDIP